MDHPFLQMQLNLYAESISNTIIDQILKSTDQKIEQISLLEFIPRYLHHELSTELHNNLSALEPSHQTAPLAIRQESMSDITKISIDNLVPKSVMHEIIPDSAIQDLGKSYRTIQSKLNVKRKRQSAMVSLSSSIVQSTQGKKSIHKKSGAGFSSARKKQQKSQLISVFVSPEEDDQDFKSVRIKKDSLVQEEQRQRFLFRQRKNEREQKSEAFLSAYESKDYTFDFQGSVVEAAVNNDGNINYNGVGSKLGGYLKKMREDLKFVDQASKSLAMRKPLRKQQNMDGIFAVDHIPMPQKPTIRNSMFGPPPQLSKFTFQDYSKHHGGKFHRLDRSQRNTIDVVDNEEDPYDELFRSRREIKDVDQTRKSLNVDVERHHGIARRIALPKLKGVYRVLDRYQQY